MTRPLPLLVAFAAALPSCAPTPEPGLPVIEVTVRDGRISAPDTATAGWRLVRVTEDSVGHIVVLFRMEHAPDSAALAAFTAALDTARQTPAGAMAMGGPEMGSVGEVIADLSPGVYVLGCVSRDEQGHRHAGLGEVRLLEAKGPAREAVPTSSPVDLGLNDYAFATSATWPAGAQLIKVSNQGREDHQVRIERLRPGVSLRQWLAAEDHSLLSEPLAGVARMSAGRTAYLPLELTAGTYVLYCLVTGAATGMPHVMMGMMRTVTVE